jgi:Tol biopolymer transport system component
MTRCASRLAPASRCRFRRLPRTGPLRSRLTVLGALMLVGCGGGENRAHSVRCSSPAPNPQTVGPESGLRGRIVWASNRAGGNLDLFVRSLDGEGIRQVTHTPANETVPVWSPDGTQIAFMSFQEDLASLDLDTSPGQIKLMNADGTGMRELTAPEPQSGALTWSPDGKRIAFATHSHIEVMRTDGARRRRLADVGGYEDWPSWAPDGDRILVTSSESGREELVTIRADGSSSTRLSQKGSEGAWSPDGQSIAFASNRDGEPEADDPRDWNDEIYVMPRDGSHATRITRIPGNDHWPPAWSPDGRHIAFTSDGCKDNWEILIADTQGSRVLNATHHPARDVFPSWHR